MNKPTWIHIWAEDPVYKTFLGGLKLPYSSKECAKGGYRYDLEAIRSVAKKANKSIRTPRLRLKFEYI